MGKEPLGWRWLVREEECMAPQLKESLGRLARWWMGILGSDVECTLILGLGRE